MLKLYGNARSRAARCLWMLEEIGERYELIQTSLRVEDLKNPTYLDLNPNARIPTLVDGDIVLWESMAINLYLSQRAGPMQARSAEALGLAAQWSFWTALEMEALLLDLLSHRILLSETARDISQIEKDTLLLQRPLSVLDGALNGRDHLVGDAFTVADLNVASILVWGKIAGLDFSRQPNVARWLERSLARPAYRRVWLLQNSSDVSLPRRQRTEGALTDAKPSGL
jgi:glutathione S-transferase